MIESTSELFAGQSGAEAVALQITPATHRLVKGVRIKALAGNSDIVYVGPSTVSVTTGFELSAGNEVFIEIDNPAKVYTIATPSQNEKQLVTYVSGATNETFKLSFIDQTTTAIAYDAVAATVETAFEALSTVGAGNGTVTGSAGGPWTIEFTGTLAGLGQVMVTASEVGVNEIQTITYSGDAATDTYTLTFDSQVTGVLNVDDNNATILTALEALSNINSGDVVLTGGSAPGTPVIVTFGGQYLRTDAAAITGVGGTNEVQTVTLSGTISGDTFDITYDSQTTSMLAIDASATTVQTALEALSNLAPDDVIVTGDDGGPYTLSYGGTLVNTDLTEVTGTAGTNEIQTVAIDSATTGGTFKLTYSTQQTGTIAWNADAAAVETALKALSNIAPGDVTVTGGDGPSTDWAVEFTGALAQTDVTAMTGDGSLLTGGSTTVTITTTTPGNSATVTPATIVAGNELTVSVVETQKGASKTVTISESQSASQESKYSWIGQ